MLIGQCIENMNLSNGVPLALLSAGLVGGFTHCAGMCAPFVLAQIDGEKRLTRPHEALLIPYHLGRMTTYIALAVLVHSVVNLAFLFSGAQALIVAPLLMLAGVIFFVSAFPKLAFVFPWAGSFRGVVPYQILSKGVSYMMRGGSALHRYGLGVLLGFMPCGLVVSALLAVSTLPSALEAAFAMGIFALGTVPALVMVAFGGRAIVRAYPNFKTYISQGAMAISGLWLFVLAGRLLF